MREATQVEKTAQNRDSQPGELDLSVSIVCKNNRDTIEQVIQSISGLAAEIIAVDSGSTDGTIEILESSGVKVIRSEWLGYVKTKQKALDACSKSWVLSLDSDESLEPVLAQSIRTFIEKNESGVDGARLNRQIWYRGKPLAHAWQPEWRLRLVRREMAEWRGLDPHDKLELTQTSGRIINLKGQLRHDSFSSFAEHLESQARCARIMAQSLHEHGQGTSYLRPWLSALTAFLKQILIRGAWLDGRAGWLAVNRAATSAFIKHVVLLELRPWKEE